MESILSFILIISAIGMAISYLYFLRYIRKFSGQEGDFNDNFFVLNFLKVYKKFMEIRKYNNKRAWVLLNLHFLFIIITLVLGLLLEGK
jgi:hypothetical protein